MYQHVANSDTVFFGDASRYDHPATLWIRLYEKNTQQETMTKHGHFLSFPALDVGPDQRAPPRAALDRQ